MAAALATVPSRYDSPEIVSVIKQTVAKGASDAQLRMFLEVCRSTGLDPFLKEIYFVAEKSLIMAARDGYLRVANEHPQFDGMDTRVERDEKNVPIKATCSVWRKDRSHPITCEAYYSEYRKPGPVWSQYPSAMISKVAEVLALKRSFAINGVVTEEELGTDSRGSVEAAQEVAHAKIAAMSRGPQPVAAVIEQDMEAEYVYEELPEDEQPSQPEQELHDSIIAVEAAKLQAGRPRLNPDRFAMLQAFGQLKSRYQSIGFLHTYYAILARYSVRHSNEFPDTEEGLSEARCCYKEMSIDVSNREVRGRR